MSKGDIPQYAASPPATPPGLLVFIDDVVRCAHRGDCLIHVFESDNLAELSFQVFREKLPDPVLDVIHDLVAVLFSRVICFEGIDVFL